PPSTTLFPYTTLFRSARAPACCGSPAPPELSMPKRMLIDASHPEETRVVVFDGNKVEEFDFEAASKRPLKGNIYLAKVTRVEPSDRKSTRLNSSHLVI